MFDDSRTVEQCPHTNLLQLLATEHSVWHKTSGFWHTKQKHFLLCTELAFVTNAASHLHHCMQGANLGHADITPVQGPVQRPHCRPQCSSLTADPQCSGKMATCCMRSGYKYSTAEAATGTGHVRPSDAVQKHVDRHWNPASNCPKCACIAISHPEQLVSNILYRPCLSTFLRYPHNCTEAGQNRAHITKIEKLYPARMLPLGHHRARHLAPGRPLGCCLIGRISALLPGRPVRPLQHRHR